MKLLVAVEDSLVARQAGAHLGRCGHAVTITSDVNEAIALVSSADPPKLIVLGGSFAGLALEFTEGAQGVLRARPYVLLYLDERRVAEESISAGADVDDVLVQPCSLQEVEARVRLGARIVELQEQTASAQDGLLFAATHDAITGAFTRTALLDSLDRERARADREGGTVGVLAVHIVEIETVRTAHGPIAYDLLLHEVACRVRDVLRTYDVLGRGRSDVILAVLPGVDTDSAARVATRLKVSIESAPFDISVGLISVTCRVGLAVAVGAEGRDSYALVAEAEASALPPPAVGDPRSQFRLRSVIENDESTYPTLRVNRGGLS